MKISISKELINPNSTEEKDLYLRDVYVGKYSYGTYSKLVRIKSNNGKFLGSFENYVCGMIHKYFNIPVLTKEDVCNAINICKSEENMELIDWINKELGIITKDYVNES